MKLYNNYYIRKQGSINGTANFIKAGNTVYKAASAMMRTAQRMYRNDPALYSNFTYAHLITIVRGKGFTKSGCRFYLKDAFTGEPLRNVTLIITSDELREEQQSRNKSSITVQLPAGKYNFTLTAPGFTTIIGTLKIKVGTKHQKTVEFARDTAGVAAFLQADAI